MKNIEIEKKYLVTSSEYKQMATNSHTICQGYLNREPDRTVRVRILDDKGFLTVKGRNHGAVRKEFEYEIPHSDAEELLALCIPPIIRKRRYIVHWDGFTWEVDEFFREGKDALVVAEIELPSEHTIHSLPPFVGEEVTGNPDYYNSNIK